MGEWVINNVIMLFVAFFLDLFIGDPKWLPHPVVGMGKIASCLENRLNRNNLISGFVATLLFLIIIALFSLIILTLSYNFSRISYIIIGSIAIFFTIALKSLISSGTKILNSLKKENVKLARNKVAEIVGRDTEAMTEDEIIRATIESLAENFIDGFFAPAFWTIIGGPIGAIIYRGINTLDSMWGYKNQRYLYFGRWAARLDDLVNFFPARIGVLLLLLSGLMLRYNFKNAIKVWLRDAHKHPSPNSGHAEAVVAGLLGVQLGGLNYYHGQPQTRATMGDKIKDFSLSDIINTQKILLVAGLFTVFLAGLFSIILIVYRGVM